MSGAHYVVVRDGWRWAVVWTADDGERIVEKFWTFGRARHIADHLRLAYHYGATAPRGASS